MVLRPFKELEHVGRRDEPRNWTECLKGEGLVFADGEEGPVVSRRDATECIFRPWLKSSRHCRRRRPRYSTEHSEKVLFKRSRRLIIQLLRWWCRSTNPAARCAYTHGQWSKTTSMRMKDLVQFSVNPNLANTVDKSPPPSLSSSSTERSAETPPISSLGTSGWPGR
jgi:hypothetical protein